MYNHIQNFHFGGIPSDIRSEIFFLYQLTRNNDYPVLSYSAKVVFLFQNQTFCCGYLKEPSQ